MTERYLVIIEKCNRNYGAYSPDIDGCVATGDTIENTIENITSAITFHLEGMAENGEDLPEPKSISIHLGQDEFDTKNNLITFVEVQLPLLVA
jgi:predicted RNase H-like HicB family nuclease